MAAESSSRPGGTGGDAASLPSSEAELEREIEVRRNHLAATIDELTTRANPKEIARRSTAGLRARVQGAVRTADGQVRTERLGAVAGAVLVVLTVLVWVRRRR